MTEGTGKLSPGRTADGRLQQALLFSYYSLLLFFLLVSLRALESPGISTPVIWLIQVFPLLIFAPGLHRQNPRSFLWLSLVVLGMAIPWLHQGMIYCGIPYTEPGLNTTESGGTPYGASHTAGTDSNLPITDTEAELCRALGKRIAALSLRLAPKSS